MSDTNQVVIHWKSEGTYQYFDFSPQGIPSLMETFNGNNMGWSLDYEIGAIDGDNNFGEF